LNYEERRARIVAAGSAGRHFGMAGKAYRRYAW